MRACVLVLLAAAFASSCQEPTEIRLELSTDVACSRIAETSITAGTPDGIDSRPPGTSTKHCDEQSHRIGSIVLVPSSGEHDEVATRIVTGIGKSAEACVRDGYKRRPDELPSAGCIVARRQLAYVPNQPLTLPIELRQDCIDIPCDSKETCLRGGCVPPVAACSASGLCGLIATVPPDGGSVDGARRTRDGSSGPIDGGIDASEDGPSAPCSVPADARLVGLVVSEGTLSPGFDGCVDHYTLALNLPVQSLGVVATTAAQDAIIRVNGSVVGSGTEVPVALPLGMTTITVQVTPANGVAATYTVDVDRGTNVVQSAFVKASNTGAQDFFGVTVALSGNTLAVGAPGESSDATGVNGDQTNNRGPGSGAVYVFVRSGATWTQQAYIKPSNASGLFGSSLALDGETLVVGALAEKSNATGVDGNQANTTAAQSGAAYVFSRSGTSWTQEAYLKASNTGAGDEFGYNVAVSGDTVAVGAPFESSNARTINGNQANDSAVSSGAAYVFVRTGVVPARKWAQQAYVKASNADAQDTFGRSVALSGSTLAVGADSEDGGSGGVNGSQANNNVLTSGAVYMFSRSGSSWAQDAYVKAAVPLTDSRFGGAISLFGNTLAVGARREPRESDSGYFMNGAAYLFVRSGGAWTQQARVESLLPVGDFGGSIAVSGDTLLVGSDYGAYAFVRSGVSWAQKSELAVSKLNLGDFLAGNVAVANGTMAAGGFLDDSSAAGVDGIGTGGTATSSGAVYVFR